MTRGIARSSARLGILLGLATAACGSGSSSETASAAAVSVTAQGFAFHPTPLTIPGGVVTVTFTNKDTAEHSLTLDDNSKSVDVEGGSSGTLTFTAPASGTVTYHCKYHSTMHGTFSVGAAGSVPAGSSSGGGGGY